VQVDHIRHQAVFVQSAPWPPPLCGSMLAKCAADPTLGYSQLATDMINTKFLHLVLSHAVVLFAPAVIRLLRNANRSDRIKPRLSLTNKNFNLP
jgi:hypothetical protein